MDDSLAGWPRLLVGRYRLGRLLGRGGIADVRAAVDERDGSLVAVKLFRDPLLSEEDRGVRDGEARALAGLRHPGLVQLRDVGQHSGRPFCVMTLVDGPTLAERLAAGPLGLPATAGLGVDVACALAYVHEQGVVHRDVKPANVLIGADGRPRLADFGIARLADATRVTGTNLLVGTAGYLAPEQVTAGHIGPAVDVYALGLVLLECLTGRREYEGPPIEAALARLHRRPQLPEPLPAGWAALLHALTADAPAQRPTAATSAAALGVLVAQPDAPPAALALNSPATQAHRTPDGTRTGNAGDGPTLSAPSRRGPDSRRRRRAGLAGALLLAPVAALTSPDLLSDNSAADSARQLPAAVAAPPGPLATGGPSASGPGRDTTTDLPGPVTAEQDLQNLIAALKAESTGDRPAAGQDARKVLKRLREVARLEGAAQDNTAIALNEDVRAAVRAGRLDAHLGRRTSQVLDRVTAAPDLVALVRLALHDPSALGSAGDELTRRLYALDHRTRGANVPPAAAATLTFIRKGVSTGALVPAVGRAADPVLKPLARPEPLRKLDALIAELRRDPRAAGPDGRTVLSRLQSLETLPVYRRTFEARALTGILRDGPRNGGLTTTFRDRALPVLHPLAQQPTSDSSSARNHR